VAQRSGRVLSGVHSHDGPLSIYHLERLCFKGCNRGSPLVQGLGGGFDMPSNASRRWRRGGSATCMPILSLRHLEYAFSVPGRETLEERICGL